MDYEQAEAINSAVRRIAIRHRARAATLLSRLGLHPGQEVFLLELAARGPCTQGQLAARSGCEPPVVTVGARKLEEAGFLVRNTSPADRRVTVVELSDKGRAVIPQLQQLWQELAEQTVVGLRATPLDQLVDTLADLAHSLERCGGSSPARPDPSGPC